MMSDQIACFLMMPNPTVWRWSHARHHTDTIIVGRDPEIITMRPPEMAKVLLNFFGILDIPQSLAAMLRYATGTLTVAEQDLIPESERPKMIFVARIWMLIYAGTVVIAIWTGSSVAKEDTSLNELADLIMTH